MKGVSYKILGIVLIALACVLWALIFVIPFLKLSTVHKGVIITAIVIIAEVIFWVGSFMAGAEFVYKFFKKRADSKNTQDNQS